MKKKSSIFAFILVLAFVLSMACTVWVGAAEVTNTIDNGGLTTVSAGDTDANYVVTNGSILCVPSGVAVGGFITVEGDSYLTIGGVASGNVTINGNALIQDTASIAAITCGEDATITIEDGANVGVLNIAGTPGALNISEGAIIGVYNVEADPGFAIYGSGETIVNTSKAATGIYGTFAAVYSYNGGDFYVTYGNDVSTTSGVTTDNAVQITTINGGNAKFSGHSYVTSDKAVYIGSTDANSGLILNGGEDSVFELTGNASGNRYGNLMISGCAVNMHDIRVMGTVTILGDSDVTVGGQYDTSWNFIGLDSGNLTLLEDFVPYRGSTQIDPEDNRGTSDAAFHIKDGTQAVLQAYTKTQNGNFINKTKYYIPIYGTFNSIGGAKDGDMFSRISIGVAGHTLKIKGGGTSASPNHIDVRITSCPAYAPITTAGIEFGTTGQSIAFYQIKSSQPKGPQRIDINIAQPKSIIELQDGYFGTVRVYKSTLKTTEADGVYRIRGAQDAILENSKADWYPNVYGSFEELNGCAAIIGVDQCSDEVTCLESVKVDVPYTNIYGGSGTLKLAANTLHEGNPDGYYYNAESHNTAHYVTNSATIAGGKFTIISSEIQDGNNTKLTVSGDNTVVTIAAVSGAAMDFSTIEEKDKSTLVLDSTVSASALTVNGSSSSGSKKNLVVNVPQNQIAKVELKNSSFTDICSGASIENTEISEECYIALESGNLQGETIYFDRDVDFTATPTAFKVTGNKTIHLSQRAAAAPVELIADGSISYTVDPSGYFTKITAKGSVKVETQYSNSFTTGDKVYMNNVTAPAVVVDGENASVIIACSSEISTNGDNAVLVSGGSFSLMDNAKIKSSGTAIFGDATSLVLSKAAVESDDNAIVISSTAFDVYGATTITGNAVSKGNMSVKPGSNLNINGSLASNTGKLFFAKNAAVHITEDLFVIGGSFENSAAATVDEDAYFGAPVVNSGAALTVKGSLIATKKFTNDNVLTIEKNAAFNGELVSTGSAAMLKAEGKELGSEQEALYLNGKAVIENGLEVESAKTGIHIASQGAVTINVNTPAAVNIKAVGNNSFGIYNEGKLTLIDGKVTANGNALSTAIYNSASLFVGTHNSTAAAITPELAGENGIINDGANAKAVIYNANIGSESEPIANIAIDTQKGADTAILAYGHNYGDVESPAAFVNVYANQEAFKVADGCKWAIRGNNVYMKSAEGIAINTRSASPSAITTAACEYLGKAPVSGGTYVGAFDGSVAGSSEIESYVIEGNYYLVSTGGATTVVNAEIELREALEDESGAAVYQLPCDIKLGWEDQKFHGVGSLVDQGDINVKGTHTLDLNGYNLWINSAAASQVIEIGSGSALTVINSSTSGILFNNINGKDAVLVDGGSLVVSEAALQASGCAIKVISNGSLTINQGIADTVNVVSGNAVVSSYGAVIGLTIGTQATAVVDESMIIAMTSAGVVDVNSGLIFASESTGKLNVNGGYVLDLTASGITTVSGGSIKTMTANGDTTVNAGTIGALTTGGITTVNGGSIKTLTASAKLTVNNGTIKTLTAGGETTVSGGAITTALAENKFTQTAGTVADITASGSAAVLDLKGGELTGSLLALDGTTSVAAIELASCGAITVSGGSVTVEREASTQAAIKADVLAKAGTFTAISGCFDGSFTVSGSATATLNAGTQFKAIDNQKTGGKLIHLIANDVTYIEKTGSAKVYEKTVYLTNESSLPAIDADGCYYILKTGDPEENPDITITTSGGALTICRVPLRDGDVTRTAAATVSFAAVDRQVAWSFEAQAADAESGVTTDAITFSKAVSESGEEITITVASNAAAGVYTVAAAAVNNTSVKDTFVITVSKVNISGAEFTLNNTDWIPSTWDDGKAITVSALSVGGVELTEGEFEFEHNCVGVPSAVEFTATATAVGCDFTGVVTTNFRLAQKSLTDGAEVSLSGSGQHQDGSDKTIVITVNYSGSALTAGSDYTVSGTTQASVAGIYNVTITGINDYIGEIAKSWTIAEPYTPPAPGPSGSGSSTPKSYEITLEDVENGSVSTDKTSAVKGETVVLTLTPNDGYEVLAFIVLDKNGKEIETKDLGNGSYSFEMPAGKVNIKSAFEKKTKTFFVDVPADAYFYEPVFWAADCGITDGVDETHFAPDLGVKRAQVVTFLWRTAGKPEPAGTAPVFTDVVSGSYYEKAVAWAYEQGITKGTTETTFSPEDTCLRGQVAAFLARFAGVMDTDTASVFSDVKSTDYYAAAVKWAKDNKITDGTSATTFSPRLECTRGQLVTFLYRYIVK